MKYITVTLNPALDMNIALSGPLMTEGLNRSVGAAFPPEEKGSTYPVPYVRWDVTAMLSASWADLPGQR